MKIQILSFGNKQPEWLYQATHHYQKRIPKPYSLDIVELPLCKRSDTKQQSSHHHRETAIMLSKVNRNAFRVALDLRGQQCDSQQLAQKMTAIMDRYPRIQLMIGGPEGLSDACIDECHETWALSKLTLPHALARLTMVEAIYRSLTIAIGHPYHR